MAHEALTTVIEHLELSSPLAACAPNPSLRADFHANRDDVFSYNRSDDPFQSRMDRGRT